MPKIKKLIGVIDLETTGLFPSRNHRIIEIAIVVTTPEGEITDQFCTLINPNRDIGPSHIHGIKSVDVINAPKFIDIADKIVATLKDCVAIAAHNIRFDHDFLKHEFSKIGSQIPEIPKICTMHLSGGGKLTECCERFSVELEGNSHNALNDAIATQNLLTKLLTKHPKTINQINKFKSIVWPVLTPTDSKPFTRHDSSNASKTKPSIFSELSKITIENKNHNRLTEEQEISYFAVLERVLEDRIVSSDEIEDLRKMASNWGLSTHQITDLNTKYFEAFAKVLKNNRCLSNSKHQELDQLATLLGIQDSSFVNDFSPLEGLNSDASKLFNKSNSDMVGKSVCFTGESECQINKKRLTKDFSKQLAISKGLIPVDRVTKKLDILVVADPNTQSGKAKKAKEYGIRIIQEKVFWKYLGLEVE